MNELQRKVYEAAEVRVPVVWLEKLAGLARAGAAESNDDDDTALAASVTQYTTDARLLVEKVGRLAPGRRFLHGQHIVTIAGREDEGDEDANGGLWRGAYEDGEAAFFWPRELGQEVPVEGDYVRIVFTGRKARVAGLRYGANEWEALIFGVWYPLHKIEVVAKEYGNEQ